MRRLTRRRGLTMRRPPARRRGSRRWSGISPLRSAVSVVLWMALIWGGGLVAAALILQPQPPPRPHYSVLPYQPEPPADADTLSLPASPPIRVDIDEIGVHAPISPIGVNKHDEIRVPPLSRPYLVGWYRGGAAPGQIGNSVLLGHVDSHRVGPAVFYRLGDLRRGDTVDVTRADHQVAVFRVTAVALVRKSRFPSAIVYGPTRRAGLRLITCGGTFDEKNHGYDGNTVVTANLVASHPAGPQPPLRTFIPPRPTPTTPSPTG